MTKAWLVKKVHFFNGKIVYEIIDKYFLNKQNARDYIHKQETEQNKFWIEEIQFEDSNESDEINFENLNEGC